MLTELDFMIMVSTAKNLFSKNFRYTFYAKTASDCFFLLLRRLYSSNQTLIQTSLQFHLPFKV